MKKKKRESDLEKGVSSSLRFGLIGAVIVIAILVALVALAS